MFSSRVSRRGATSLGALALVLASTSAIASAQLAAPPLEPAALLVPPSGGDVRAPTSQRPASDRLVITAPFTAAAPERRSPLVAGFLGVLPGLGHAYAGEGRRGLAVAAVWLGSGMVMFSSAHKAVTGAGAVVNIASYVFSIADAALAAERFNARHSLGSPH
jgi:hypothetical protein